MPRSERMTDLGGHSALPWLAQPGKNGKLWAVDAGGQNAQRLASASIDLRPSKTRDIPRLAMPQRFASSFRGLRELAGFCCVLMTGEVSTRCECSSFAAEGSRCE